jgi:hypothetical protein
MTDRPASPDPDPLLAEILAIAATLDHDKLRLDLTEPAFVSLVDRAVAPYEHALTPAGRAEARETATLALAMQPEIDAMLVRERARLAQKGSGLQPTRSAEQLRDAARRRPRKTGR